MQKCNQFRETLGKCWSSVLIMLCIYFSTGFNITHTKWSGLTGGCWCTTTQTEYLIDILKRLRGQTSRREERQTRHEEMRLGVIWFVETAGLAKDEERLSKRAATNLQGSHGRCPPWPAAAPPTAQPTRGPPGRSWSAPPPLECSHPPTRNLLDYHGGFHPETTPRVRGEWSLWS